MKTSVSDLPRSMNQGNEFLMLREKSTELGLKERDSWCVNGVFRIVIL